MYRTVIGISAASANGLGMIVGNLCTTFKPVAVPPDPDKPSKPDKDSTYLSDCENIVDEYGNSWNPSTVYVDSANKAEGNSSVAQN